MKEVILHEKLTLDSTVTKERLACAMGSGDLEVYGTPAMIALMEETSAALLKQFLDEGETSVGISINAAHTAATPCGMKVTASAEIIDVDRKKVTFSVVVRDEKEQIGSAAHERFVVGSEKFLAKANAKRGE